MAYLDSAMLFPGSGEEFFQLAHDFDLDLDSKMDSIEPMDEADSNEVMLVYHQLQETPAQFCQYEDVASTLDTLGCAVPASLEQPIDEVLGQHLQQSPPAHQQPRTTRRAAARVVKTEWEEDAQADDDGDLASTFDEDRTPISYDNVRSFYDLSDEQIANIDFKDLTRLMTEAHLSEDQIAEAKARRRRLKNRHSARVCSNKKREKCTELTATNKHLQTRIRSLEHDNADLRSCNAQLSETNAMLQKSAAAAAQEAAQLRAQVQHLAQLLAQAGLFADDAAALAA